MAQQELEEAADKYFPFAEKIGGETYSAYKGFITGAKWQEQKMYSEEEILKLLLQFHKDKPIIVFDVSDWFEQFKKK
jgi:hypothetical protein